MLAPGTSEAIAPSLPAPEAVTGLLFASRVSARTVPAKPALTAPRLQTPYAN
jgi:hypothetical protein